MIYKSIDKLIGRTPMVELTNTENKYDLKAKIIAKAEFFNNFYKFDAGYFNDTNENFIVFYVATDTNAITVTKSESHATISGLPTKTTVDSVLKLTANAAEDYEFTTAPTFAYTTKDGNTVTVSFVYT